MNEEPGKGERVWNAAVKLLAGGALAVLFFSALRLATTIVTTDTSLGLPETVSNAEALVRSNERLFQLAQWSISTVLIVSGGLLGLNWYQSHQRYEDLRKNFERTIARTIRETTATFERQLEQFTTDYQERLEALERRGALDLLRNRSSASVNAAKNATQACFALAEGYPEVRDAEYPEAEHAIDLLVHGLNTIDAFIVFNGDVIVARTEAERQRYEELFTVAAAEFQDRPDMMERIDRMRAAIQVETD